MLNYNGDVAQIPSRDVTHVICDNNEDNVSINTVVFSFLLVMLTITIQLKQIR